MRVLLGWVVEKTKLHPRVHSRVVVLGIHSGDTITYRVHTVHQRA